MPGAVQISATIFLLCDVVMGAVSITGSNYCVLGDPLLSGWRQVMSSVLRLNQSDEWLERLIMGWCV